VLLRDDKIPKDVVAALVGQSRVAKPYPCPAAWAKSFDKCKLNSLWDALSREISLISVA